MKIIDTKRMTAMMIALCIVLMGCDPSGSEVPNTFEPTSGQSSAEPISPTEAISLAPSQDSPVEQSPAAFIPSTTLPDAEDNYIPAEPSQAGVEWHFDSETGVLSFDGVGALSTTEPETADYINYGWAGVSEDVNSIIIGEGITRIPDFSFYGFNKVKSVMLPSTLTSIGTMAFFQCAFQEIVLPSSLVQIGSGAFSNCKQLLSCDIPASVTVLESYVFEECIALQKVTLHDGIQELEDSCFWGCDSLNSLIFPESIKILGEMHASGLRAMIFLGEPPEFPQDNMTETYLLGNPVTIYYSDDSIAWQTISAQCQEDYIEWIYGIPSN